MKPIGIATSLILVTLSLYGSAPQQSSKDANQQPDTQTAALPAAQLSGGTDDSPLVRAAKAGRRAGIKSSTVITNDTLIRTGGHFTTTDTQQPLPILHSAPVQTEEQWLTERRKKAVENAITAAEAHKAEQRKKLLAARAAQLMEGDTPEAIYNDEPAGAGPVQTLKPTAPPTMGQPQPKPPL